MFAWRREAVSYYYLMLTGVLCACVFPFISQRVNLVTHVSNASRSLVSTGLTHSQSVNSLRLSVSTPNRDNSGRISDRAGLPFSCDSPLPSFLAFDRYGHHGGVLRFEAYFKEAVPESSQEIARVRHVSIIFYCNDNTLEILEPKRENSGLAQGPFLKRHKVPKGKTSVGGASGGSPRKRGYVALADLFVGAQVDVYGRTMHIVDANGPTREALARMGRPQADAIAFPADNYEDRVQAQREAGRGGMPGVNYGTKVTEIKKYCESVAGRFYSDKPLGSFLENDRKVLRFYCMWDDTGREFGSRHRYIVHFFLTDDTAEVREQYGANSGTDPWPMLVKRGKLPKNFVNAMADGPLSQPLARAGSPNQLEDAAAAAGSAPPTLASPTKTARGVGEYYTASDIRIGGTIGVWGRPLLVTGCDEATKRYYMATFGRSEADMATITVEEPAKIVRKRPIPPPTGYGSESDSLQSFYRLVPKQPKKDLEKMQRLAQKVLRYGARLDTVRPEDAGRKFTISYVLAVDEVSVFETPERNSGIVGGQFLRPTRPVKPAGEVSEEEKLAAVRENNPCKIFFYRPKDFYIGAKVTLGGATFVVRSMDGFTKRWTANDPISFPWADPHVIAERIKEKALAAAKTETRFRQVFLEYADHRRFITKANLARMVNSYLPVDLNEQELETLMDFFDADGNGVIDYQEFRQAIFEDERSLKEIEISGAVKTSNFRRELAERQATIRRRNARVTVDEQELVNSYLSALSNQFPPGTRHLLEKVFLRHDRHHDGHITDDGFKFALLEASKLKVGEDADRKGSINIYSKNSAESMAHYFFPEGIHKMRYSDFLHLVWQRECTSDGSGAKKDLEISEEEKAFAAEMRRLEAQAAQ